MWKSLIEFLFLSGLIPGLTAQQSYTCDVCSLKTNVQHPSECKFTENGRHLVCFGGFDQTIKSKTEHVRSLILYDWPNGTFNPEEILREFPLLRTFAMSGGNLTEFAAPFPGDLRLLEELNVTETGLKRLPDHAFICLSALKIVDLSNNSLEEINTDAFNVSTLEYLNLFGNPLKCTNKMSWILDASEDSLANKIADKQKLRCSIPHEGRPLLPVIEIIMALKAECDKTVCDCELVYVVGRGGKRTQGQLMAFNSVNCSHRNFTEMPYFLPANTTTLHLSGNKIKDLTPLARNPVYRQVMDLYLDDNLIESITQLEGTYWLDHFRLLSLRGNKLSDLPTYALENVLLQSGNAARLYLSRNPWRCDCLFTPAFQDLLIRYANLIRDSNEVRCASADGDSISNKQIRELTRTEICTSPGEEYWIYPLDVLNVILALLIFLILGKLLYDYWSFKKTGKLPWIVAKIP